MNPALDPWIAIPLGLAAMLAVSAHITAVADSDHPPSRRRIRVANGWVMLLTIPLLAAGVSLVDPAGSARLFALVWAAATLLLFLTIALALADIVNTARLAARARRDETIQSLASAFGGDRNGSAGDG